MEFRKMKNLDCKNIPFFERAVFEEKIKLISLSA